MRTHVQLVALLHLFLNGVAFLIGVLCIAFAVTGGSILGLAGTQGARPGEALGVAAVLATFGSVIGCIFMVPALPGIIGAWGAWRLRPWGRVILIIVSALHVLNFPLGTAVGIYTLWALLNPETEALFRDQGQSGPPLY